MLDYALLSALAAVVRTGSFERAAEQLNVTPSAVSQRIKLLEERIGAVLVVDDQNHSAEWLRRGEVVAAVTSHGKPIQGCNCYPLGALRYLATASPAFVKRWLPDGLDEQSAARAPCLVFNRKDQLQALWLRRALGADVRPPVHWLPSSQAFVDAALAGLGWGMNLETTVQEHIREGRLVALEPSEPLEVPLYWQQSRIVGPLLADLTRAVLTTARAMLSPIAP
jgi:LysR family transcriptional regulator, chromosome initiation inhibitor